MRCDDVVMRFGGGGVVLWWLFCCVPLWLWPCPHKHSARNTKQQHHHQHHHHHPRHHRTNHAATFNIQHTTLYNQQEHLFLVCELLRANLYEFQRYQRDTGSPPPGYFTPPRLQRIAAQVLRALAFLHSLGLVHADLKPENILIKSYSRCEVKVIDLGSSCFVTDHLSSYVQSRSYRAPEVREE